MNTHNGHKLYFIGVGGIGMSGLARLADRELAGRSVPESLEAVQHHLVLCVDCREEYQVLRAALEALAPGQD